MNSIKIAAILVVLFALVTLPGCDNEARMAAKNKVIVERWTELLNTGDLAIADEILAADFVNHDPSAPEIIDLESYKKGIIVATHTAIPDFRIILQDVVTEGDKVAGRWTATGTQTGVIMGIPPTGVRYTNTWITIFRFAGGKIMEQWWNYDMLGVLQQIGVMPPTQEGPPAMQRVAPEDFVWSAPSEVTGDPGDPEANKTIVMREFEAWNQGNLDVLLPLLDEIYAADFVYHDPARPHVTDLATYKQWAAEECLAPFPDLCMPVEDMIAEGDKVAVRWAFTGTYITFGKQVTQTGTTIYRIADGEIIEAWCACDMLGTIRQIGAMAELEED